MRTKKSSQPNQSLIDGIATLQALATSDRPIGGRELARALNFEPTRANRLLKTLAYLGIAQQTPDRKYMPGAGMHVLAAQSLFASGLVRRALPVLEDLRQYNHVVAMGVLWRDNVSYLYHAPPGVGSAEALGRIGLYPASKGGIGLALLAELEEQEITEMYRDAVEIPGFPEGLPNLLSKIREIRSNGFVRVRVKEETEQHTIALTIGKTSHVAIGVSGWIPKETEHLIVQALREAVSSIIEESDLEQAKLGKDATNLSNQRIHV